MNLWVGVLFLIGCGLFAWSIVNYSPYNIVAYRSEKSSGLSVSDYKILVSKQNVCAGTTYAIHQGDSRGQLQT